jgi:hypothetical protein
VHRDTRYFLGDFAAGHRVKALHGDENREHPMLPHKGLRSVLVAVDVMLKLAVDIPARLEEIYGAILAVFVSARCGSREIFANGCAHWPNKWVNGTEHQDGSAFIPADLA